MVHFSLENYKIGVLLSAYNGEKYIAQQIESIMKQTVAKHITLLVRNDGSTDNTADILSRLQKTYSNIKVINGSNIGLITSFFELLRIGLKKYDFDYYSFSDQDDYWLPDKLETAINFLAKEDNKQPLLYGCRSKLVDELLNPTGYLTQQQNRPINFYNTAIQNILPGHNQVLNKKLAEIILQHNVQSDKIYSQDLWITNVAAVTGKIIFDNKPHTLYRMHGRNQLGYGKSKLGRIKSHIIRLQAKETQKIASQLNFFVITYDDYLSIEKIRETISFFKEKNFIKRLYNIKKLKFYRQNKNENKIFKIIYTLGFYTI